MIEATQGVTFSTMSAIEGSTPATDREGAALAAEGVGVATTVITIGVAVGSGVGVAPSNVMPQAEARARRIDRKAMFDATRAAGLGDPRWGHDA